MLIQGVLDPQDTGGGVRIEGKSWMLSFSLIRWRDEMGELHTTRLRVQRQVSEQQLSRYNRRLESNPLRALRVRLLDNKTAELIALLNTEVTDDDELSRFSQELLAPRHFHDPFFGTLTLDRRSNCYEARVLWNNETPLLSLDADSEGNLAAIPQSVRDLWEDQASWNERLLRCAVEHLLELKNDNWLDDDEEPLTEEQFMSRMRLAEISMDEDGSFSFWYDDGDLFFGHTIVVAGNLTDGPTDACFMG